MTGQSPAARIADALGHRAPGRIRVDLGWTFVSGIHVSCVAALREYFSLEAGPCA